MEQPHSIRWKQDIQLRIVNEHLWTNPLHALDTNRDGHVSPIDALFSINYLNEFGSGELSKPSTNNLSRHNYIDVSGDNFASPIDALMVINHLNTPAPVAAHVVREESVLSPQNANVDSAIEAMFLLDDDGDERPFRR